MSKKRYLSFLLAVCMIVSLVSVMGAPIHAATDDEETLLIDSVPGDMQPGSQYAPLVPQTLDFTENPIDIPNPDRGFYRPQSYVIPVTSGTNPSIPSLSANISVSSGAPTVAVNSRIVYMEFDLRNFSSNAPLNARPIGPWSAAGTAPPNYGETQPLTQAALDYVRAALQQIRNSEAVAIVKFNYDGSGRTYIDATGSNGVTYDRLIHDCEPGAPQGREWYETGTWTSNTSFTGGVRNEDDGCHIAGHEDKNWVQYHLWQLGSVFTEYEDCIMAVKGGIFGPWGEMHSSSYARTAVGYNWLLNALLDYVPASRSILVHAGGVMAWQNTEYGTNYSCTNLPPVPVRGSRQQRFGMFNDSYSAGSSDRSDSGSLSEGLSLLTTRTYNRNAVFNWIRNQNNFYGGETTSDISTSGTNAIYPRFPNVPYEAALGQSTHLNTSYSSTTYTLWANFVYNEANVTASFTPPHDNVARTAIFDPVYNGRNGLEFMRDRLGYRLVMREAAASEWVETSGKLEYKGKIQNVGFGLVVNKKNVAVILRSKDGANTYTALTDLDARDWLPDRDGRATNTAAWRDLDFTVDMSAFGDVAPGEYNIYLKINDPKETTANRRCIRFANKGDIWDAALGANLIGETKVVAPVISLTGDGIYVEVDDNMSMTVYRVEEDGSKTAMTQPISNMNAGGATALTGAPYKNALPWSTGTGTSGAVLHNNSAKLLSAKSAYLTTGTRTTGNAETAIDDFVVKNSVQESNVKTYFGTGNRLTVTGVSASSNITRISVIETTDKVPGVVSVTTKYVNNGASVVNVARFVENNFKIYDPLPAEDYIANKREAGLWTQQGAALVWGRDYVVPMFSVMGTSTTTAMDAIRCASADLVSRNNWFWGENGGLPFNDFWGTNIGILVGSAMPYMVRSMEIPTRGSGITNQNDTAYTWVGFPGKSLAPGVVTAVGTTIVGVHTGDNYQGSRQFTQAMSYISDLEVFGKKLPSDYFAVPDPDEYPEDAWQGTWESWGGGESFNPYSSIGYVLNGTFKRLGIKYVILDACWYPRGTAASATIRQAQEGGEGGYIAIPSKWQTVATYFDMPNNNTADTKKVIQRWNQFMHENGFKTAAWCMPMSVYLQQSSDDGAWSAQSGANLDGTSSVIGNSSNGGVNSQNLQITTSYTEAHPDYFVTFNAAQYDPLTGKLLGTSPKPWYRRQSGYYPQTGTGELCLGNPRVLDEYTDYFCTLMFDREKGYGFDGLKIDTQWGIYPCQALGHNHDNNPQLVYEGYSLYWKTIYDKAKAILGEDPWMKHCQCGTMMGFFTQPGTNRPITGDPGGSNVRKARYSIRMWKGLYGDNAPAVSDHVENFGTRCKSLMAAGYVLESKFYNASGTAPTTAAILKYFPMGNLDLCLPSGQYMDEYKFGFAYPEMLAYDKPDQNAKYYSIFASSAPVSSFSGGSAYVGGGETTMTYSGAAELRGLEPFETYKITVIDDNNSGNNVPLAGFESIIADADGKATVNVSFTECTILKAVKVVPEPVISDGKVKVEVDDNMSMQVFRNDGTAEAPVWVAMTQPITALDGNGATAVSGAWKNQLPWSAGTGTAAANFNNGSAKLLSAKTGYITTGTRSTTSNTAGNEVAIDDFAVTDIKNESNVKTYFGTGKRLTVTGVSASSNLTRVIVVETTDRVPGVISVTTKYTNNGAAALNVARFVESNFKIYDPLPAGDYIANKREAGLWTQQGATVVWGADYVQPMFSIMGTNQITTMDAAASRFDESPNADIVSRNNWFWGENGGLPFNDYWGTKVGILVGSAMPYCVRSMEIPTRGSGITNQHDTAYTWVGFPGKTLAPGVETKIGTTIVGVHTGDNFTGSKQFEQAMSYISDLELNGTKLPSNWLASPDPSGYPDYAWDGTWESWGGSESFNPIAAIRYVNNGVFKKLGIKYVILDAAWYPRGTSSGSGQPGGVAPTTAVAQRCGEGKYIAYWAKWRDVGEYFGMPLSASSTDAQVGAVVKKYNDFLHENGFKSAAWCMPMSFWQGNTRNPSGNSVGGFADTYPDYPSCSNAAQFDPLTGKLLAGSPTPAYIRQVGYYPQSGTCELCLGNPKVLNDYTDYFANHIFGEYGFDGLKIDTQWGIAPCLAIGHGHDGNPNAGYENYAMFWKLIYDKAKAILGEDPWMKHCQCGTMMNFFTQNGTNRPITGDPGGSNVRKARYSIRMWKGLYGDNAPAVSDHVENFGSRCKSLMAAGFVLESKFYNVNGIDPSATILKYFPMCRELDLPSGYYMDEYKFGFDYPEVLAYDKPDQHLKYFSVFASSAPVASFSGGARYVGGCETTMTYTGAVELRGLTPLKIYAISDIDGPGINRILMADAEGKATLSVNFTECLILKVEEVVNISIDSNYGIYMAPEAKMGSNIYSPKFVVDNIDLVAKTVSVILASYDDSGKMVDVEEVTSVIASNSAITIQPSLPVDERATEYKFFVWQDGYLPLTAITSLKQLK